MSLRRATADGVPPIVALLADDDLGAARESPDDLAPYERAFAAIDADPSELLAVAERDGELLGTLQLSLLPGLSRHGALRAQVEGVRVAGAARGLGLGETMMRWAVDRHSNPRRGRGLSASAPAGPQRGPAATRSSSASRIRAEPAQL